MCNGDILKFELFVNMKRFICSVALCFCAVCVFAQSKITFDNSRESVQYSPMIFGHFIEHFYTQVYGGIFDPGSPYSDNDGFRTDVIEAIKELKAPIVRWPGGCFVSTYHWKDGVGKERFPVFDKSWHVEDPNTFGTDEYVMWCRKIGAEPYICTNAGTGTPEEMSDWVEYCNLSVGKYGRQRIENGHTEPHNVKYWSIGNENYGHWELGAKTVAEWGPLVRESAKLMLSVDKNIKLFAAANSDRSWTVPLLKAASQYLDYVSIHGYWDGLAHVNNPQSFIKSMMVTDGPENTIQSTIEMLKETGCDDHVKIAFDEWNLRGWHHPWHGDMRKGFDIEARSKNDINSTYTMADALFSACFYNACIRNSKYVEIACFSPIVNTRGSIFVHKDGILKRSTYYTNWMYANLLEKNMVPVNVVTDTLKYLDQHTGVIDAVLTSNDSRDHFVLSVVNKNPDSPVKVDISAILPSEKIKKLEAVILNGASEDDFNEVGAENHIVPVNAQLKVSGDGCVELQPHSLTIIKVSVSL